MRNRIRIAVVNSQGVAGVTCLAVGVGLHAGLWAALIVLGIVLLAAEAWSSR